MCHVSRFTPTGVGTATARAKRRGLSPVHPHGRGDSENMLDFKAIAYGSPPRAWGQLMMLPNPNDMIDGSPPRAWGQLMFVPGEHLR